MRERTVIDREDDLRERALELDREAEDVEKKLKDYTALEKLLSTRMDQETLLRFLGGATKEFVRKARTHTYLLLHTYDLNKSGARSVRLLGPRRGRRPHCRHAVHLGNSLRQPRPHRLQAEAPVHLPQGPRRRSNGVCRGGGAG